jgi:hypothetical protein
MRPSMDKLEFIEEGHIYKVNGVIYPSVTQIIGSTFNSMAGIPAFALNKAANFGTAVHKAVELSQKGILEADSLDKALLPHLEAWKAFCLNYAYKPKAQEFRGYNERLKVAYTIDCKGFIKGHAVMIDIKSGKPKPEDVIQISAYGYLDPGFETYLLYLSDKGYKAVHVTGSERKKGEQTFLSCLNIFNYKREHKLL